jgi:beta-glucosidase/6-phospho-beta-glucosidase/beta-galactosidase
MRHRHTSGSPFFLFATGIENGAPTIQQGAVRVDEMDRCHHYTRWREDFELVRELGIRFLRYGVPLHRAFPAADRLDCSISTDESGRPAPPTSS